MRIVLLCATRRGLLCLAKLAEMCPGSGLTVFSFREEPWEPPFLDNIRELTLANNSQFYEARQIGSLQWKSFWERTQVDLMLAVNWRYMIPPDIYRRPRLGTFIFHDSLLPEYRGFSPTVWAMLNGEKHTGVTLFEISEKIDEGDIVDQLMIPIGQEDTIAAVTERVTQGYLSLLECNFDKLLNGNAPRHFQDHTRATYTCRRLPEDNQIDWLASSTQIYNLVRAVTAPYPGAYTYLAGKQLRVWSACLLQDEQKKYVGHIPGRVVEVRQGIGSVVLTGDGSLLLTQVQTPDGEPACGANVLNSLKQTLGRRFREGI